MRLGRLAIVGLSVIAVTAVASGCSDGPNPRQSYVFGLRAVRAVDDAWGACLSQAGVGLTHATGQAADDGGAGGIVLRFDHNVRFFVVDPRSDHPRAIPADRMTGQLLAAAERRQAGCDGRRSGQLWTHFGEATR